MLHLGLVLLKLSLTSSIPACINKMRDKALRIQIKFIAQLPIDIAVNNGNESNDTMRMGRRGKVQPEGGYTRIRMHVSVGARGCA
jgi:hypothetical protein